MSFWSNVDNELNYLGKTRKQLASEANFPDSYISKGISRQSIPSADLALRIAHALDVSLEELLDFPAENDSTKSENSSKIRLYKKYREVIETLESLSESNRQNAMKIIFLLKQISSSA
jgi:transcriptional regulator with XRE-family HTH domain